MIKSESEVKLHHSLHHSRVVQRQRRTHTHNTTVEQMHQRLTRGQEEEDICSFFFLFDQAEEKERRMYDYRDLVTVPFYVVFRRDFIRQI